MFFIQRYVLAKVEEKKEGAEYAQFSFSCIEGWNGEIMLLNVWHKKLLLMI